MGSPPPPPRQRRAVRRTTRKGGKGGAERPPAPEVGDLIGASSSANSSNDKGSYIYLYIYVLKRSDGLRCYDTTLVLGRRTASCGTSFKFLHIYTVKYCCWILGWIFAEHRTRGSAHILARFQFQARGHKLRNIGKTARQPVNFFYS